MEHNMKAKKTLVASFSRTGENYSVGNIAEGNTHMIAYMSAADCRAQKNKQTVACQRATQLKGIAARGAAAHNERARAKENVNYRLSEHLWHGRHDNYRWLAGRHGVCLHSRRPKSRLTQAGHNRET